jgi:hypothetical protein
MTDIHKTITLSDVQSCLLGYKATRQYNPEDSSEHHTRRRENLKSHITLSVVLYGCEIWSPTIINPLKPKLI